MPGGDIQLVLKGSHDLYLTGNPNISFFKSAFKRHTPFSMELIKINPQNTDTKLREISEYDLTFKIPSKTAHSGDLIKNTFFVFELPEIYSSPNFGFQWIKRIGEHIIKEISFFIGSKKMDTITGEWLQIWSELYLDVNKKGGYERMIGHVGDIHSSSNTSQKIGDAFTPAILSRKIVVPIPFWYSYIPGCELPLCCLGMDEQPSIKVKLRPFSELYTVLDYHTDNAEDTAKKRMRPTKNENIGHFIASENYEKIDEINKFIKLKDALMGTPPITLTIPGGSTEQYIVVYLNINTFGIVNPSRSLDGKIKSVVDDTELDNVYISVPFIENIISILITNSNPGNDIGGDYTFIDLEISGLINDDINNHNYVPELEIHPSLEINYIFLGDDERRKFESQTHNYFIRQLSIIKEEVTAPKKIISLENFKNSSTKIVWVLRRSDYEANNQWYNFTNWPDSSIDPIANHSLNFDVFNNDLTDSIIKDSTNDTYSSLLHKECFLHAGFSNNGNSFIDKNWKYYTYINHYSHSLRIPSFGIYQYSFEEASDIENWKPNRVINLSLIKKLTFDIKLTGKEKGKDYYYNLFLYSYHYNILNISNKKAEMLYAT